MKKLIFVLLVSFSCAIPAMAQFIAPVPGITKPKYTSVTSALDKAKAATTTAQKQAASCDVQKAVKASLPAGFPYACEARCGC